MSIKARPTFKHSISILVNLERRGRQVFTRTTLSVVICMALLLSTASVYSRGRGQSVATIPPDIRGLQLAGAPDASWYQRWGTLKVLTYNTFLRSWPVGSGDDCDCRARQIGRRLRGSDYDVVILQETFSDDLDELLDELHGEFPHRITHRPDEPDFPAEQDGGITVLSKQPFDLTLNFWRYHPITRTYAYYYGWKEFIYPASHCSGADCLANKGLVYLRVWVGAVGWVTLIGTHTDAKTGAGDIAARLAQADDIGEFIQNRRNAGDLPVGEPVLIMGDLNVDDSGFNGQSTAEFTDFINALTANGTRGTATNLFSFYHPGNKSLTSDPNHNSVNFFNGGSTFARLDHIIHLDNDEPFYVTVESASDVAIAEFADSNQTCQGGWNPFSMTPFDHLSDHYGVEAKLSFYKYQPPPFPNSPPHRPRSVGYNWVPVGVYADGRNDNAENYTGRYTVTWTLADPWDGGPADYYILYEQLYNQRNHYWELPAVPIVGNTVDNDSPRGYNGTYAWRIEKFLPPGQTYSYEIFRYLVEACNTHGCSSQKPSEPITVVLGDPPPSQVVPLPVEVVTLATGNKSARVSWREKTPAERYVVTRSFDGHPFGTDETLYDGPFPHDGVLDPELCAGIYSYQVRVCNKLTCGKPTRSEDAKITYDEPKGAPSAPGAVSVPLHCGPNCQYEVKWTTATGAASYELYESPTPDFANQTLVYKGKATSSPVIVKSFDSGTYYYRVRSRNSAGVTHMGYMRGANGVDTKKR